MHKQIVLEMLKRTVKFTGKCSYGFGLRNQHQGFYFSALLRLQILKQIFLIIINLVNIYNYWNNYFLIIVTLVKSYNCKNKYFNNYNFSKNVFIIKINILIIIILVKIYNY